MGDLIQSLSVPAIVNGRLRNSDKQEAAAQGYSLIQDLTLYNPQKESYSL